MFEQALISWRVTGTIPGELSKGVLEEIIEHARNRKHARGFISALDSAIADSIDLPA